MPQRANADTMLFSGVAVTPRAVVPVTIQDRSCGVVDDSLLYFLYNTDEPIWASRFSLKVQNLPLEESIAKVVQQQGFLRLRGSTLSFAFEYEDTQTINNTKNLALDA